MHGCQQKYKIRFLSLPDFISAQFFKYPKKLTSIPDRVPLQFNKVNPFTQFCYALGDPLPLVTNLC